jgi:hypothetical protein
MIRSLTPFVYSEGRDWRFRLESDLALQVDTEWLGVHRFADEKGITWLTLNGRTITIASGYAWDGSSPKRLVFGVWVGTPDFESTRMASLVHDALYQFLHVPCFPLRRQDCDRLFGRIMRSQGFPLWWVYSGAVLVCGGVHRALTGGVREGRCGLEALT